MWRRSRRQVFVVIVFGEFGEKMYCKVDSPRVVPIKSVCWLIYIVVLFIRNENAVDIYCEFSTEELSNNWVVFSQHYLNQQSSKMALDAQQLIEIILCIVSSYFLSGHSNSLLIIPKGAICSVSLMMGWKIRPDFF